MFSSSNPPRSPAEQPRHRHASFNGKRIIEQLFAIAMLFSMLRRASGETCLESKDGYQYRLECQKNETNIANDVMAKCDFTENCSNFTGLLVSAMEFCKGALGDPVCTLSYHRMIPVDKCITDVIENTCDDGIFTGYDAAVIALMSVIIVIPLCIGAGFMVNRKHALEKARLFSQDKTTTRYTDFETLNEAVETTSPRCNLQ